MFKNLIPAMLLAFCLIPPSLIAGDIPDQVKAQLESKNIPLYPGAVYCAGEASMGARFASDESPEKVREWYKAKFPKWSVLDEYGSWTLYDGPPEAGFGIIMSAKRFDIKANEQLPSWHSLSSNMTTEILIAFPD